MRTMAVVTLAVVSAVFLAGCGGGTPRSVPAESAAETATTTSSTTVVATAVPPTSPPSSTTITTSPVIGPNTPGVSDATSGCASYTNWVQGHNHQQIGPSDQNMLAQIGLDFTKAEETNMYFRIFVLDETDMLAALGHQDEVAFETYSGKLMSDCGQMSQQIVSNSHG